MKVRLAAKHASAIQKALRNSVDVKKITDDFFSSFNLAPIATQEARTWAALNVRPRTDELHKTLTRLYSEGFVLGQDIGVSAIAQVVVTNKASSTAPSLKDFKRALAIDWSTWKPGHRAAAQLVKPSGALKALMNSRDATIEGITRTTLDRIGTQLAYALQRGLTASSVSGNIADILGKPSAERAAYLAQQSNVTIKDIVNDPERALLIANTEMTRAVSVANRETYLDSGVELVEWIVSDPCDECELNNSASPLPIDEEFPSGDTEPPAHPNCVCDLSPYVVDTMNLGADALSFILEGN